MATKQDTILKVRATLNEKTKDKIKILKRTHPTEIVRWFGRSIKNLPNNTKNLLVKTGKKIKSVKTIRISRSLGKIIPKVFKGKKKK